MKRILLHTLTTIVYLFLMNEVSTPVNLIGLVDLVFLTLLYVAINYFVYISGKKENHTN